MSSPFPPLGGWTVLEDDVFETYLPASSPTETTMGTLVQISPEGVFSGNFRLVLAGDRSIKGQIMASHLLAVPGASSYRLSIEMRPEEISFRSNGVTSDWFDADQSIAEGRIKVTTLDGSPDDGSALRAAIKKASSRNPAGASFRWAINTSRSGDITLQVPKIPSSHR